MQDYTYIASFFVGSETPYTSSEGMYVSLHILVDLLMLFFYHVFRSYKVGLSSPCKVYLIQLYIVNGASVFFPVQYKPSQLYILSELQMPLWR